MRRQATGPSQASSAEVAQARQYLFNPPFYIDCDYEEREKIKLAGAQWSGTAKKWFAPTVDRLRKLIEPGATARFNPTGLCERSVQHLLSAINELENAKSDNASAPPKAQQQAPPLLLTADEKEAQRRRDLNIGSDTPETLSELKNALGGLLEQDGAPSLSQILEAAATWALGPHYGLSEGDRLLRGLYNGLVSVKQVLTLNGPDAEPKTAATVPPPPNKQPRAQKRTRVDDGEATTGPARPSPAAQPVRSLHLGLPPQRRPSCLQQRRTQEQRRVLLAQSKAPFNPPTTVCGVCNTEVQYQFGSCKCVALVWTQNAVTSQWESKDYSLCARADAHDAGDAGSEFDADAHWEDVYFREQAARVRV